MSDIPQLDSDDTDPLELHIAAIALSVVVGAFVSYWISYGLHTVVNFIDNQFANNPLSWVLSILVGVIIGAGSAYRMYIELSEYAEN